MNESRIRSRSVLAVTCAILAITLAAQALPAAAVQTPHNAVVSDNPVNWTPNILDGRVNAVLQMGGKVIVGGTFSQVQPAGTTQTLTRNNIFAFDMATGVIDTNFVPQLPNDVEALAPGPDGQSVFVGGAFSSVNGNTGVRRLVRLNLSNGQIVAGFQANATAAVMSLVLRGTWLYASGRFTTIGGATRSGLARLNPVTGAVDANLNLPFTDPQQGGSLTVRKIDVAPNGSRLVAIGNFSRVAGIVRNQIAVVELGTTPATLSTWQTDQTPFFNPANPTQSWCSPAFATYLHDVDIAPDGQYFVLVTTGAYRANRLCDTVSRWEMGASGTGQLPTWVDWAGGDTFWGVAATGAAVYAGGHQRWMNNPYRSNDAGPGAVAREGIAALDPLNGLPYSWDPGRARGVGVFDLVGTPDGLWVGSDTDRLGGETRRKIGLFPLTGGTVVPPNVPYGLPNDLYAMPLANGTLVRRPFNGTTYGAATTVNTGVNWASARGAFALNGLVYTGQSNGTMTVRSFDGATMGAEQPVPFTLATVVPGGNFLIPGTTTQVPAFSTHLANMTGMFFHNGRVYYTVSGNPRLYFRYFTPESRVVGASLFVGSTGGGVDWSNVRGMTLANGNLFFALANGNLFRVAWNGTSPTGPVTQLGGPGMDGVNWAARGLFAFSASTDTTPPTAPGTPTGVSTGLDSIDLTWPAASDASLPLTYRIYRDGGAVPVGTVQSGSTTTVTFIDTGLVAGSTHTYTVDAVDAAGNEGPMSPSSAPITVMSQGGGPFFADDFSSGGFANWTGVTRLTIDGAQGDPSAPSARGNPSGQSAFAFRNLPTGQTSACFSVRVNLSAQGATGVDLFRLRSAGNGALARVFVNVAGTLFVRADFSGAQISSGTALGTGWHEIELCGTVGATGTWTLYRDGVPIVSDWVANTGAAAIGRVQIGDVAAKTWTANWDDVELDGSPG